MKTFFHLIQEVQKPGLCHRCGGCVTFCTAINYGALELDPEGKPRYKDIEKCIECGLCYSICPEIGELDEETRRMTSWSAPIGRMLNLTVARAADPDIRAKATDGGVVTALLLHLFDMGRIDGAVVSGSVGAFHREPLLAVTREEILGAAGFHFDTVHGMTYFSGLFSAMYSSFVPSVLKLGDVTRRRLDRVAFVGTPCQINALRRMEALGIVPSGSIKYHFGLFCSGNFAFGEAERRRLEELGGFKWDDVNKVNVKEELMLHLKGGEVRTVPIKELDFMKRYACRYCGDYTAEFADISFGGIGSPEGWTTLIIRSPLGRAVVADAKGGDIEEYSGSDRQRLVSDATAKVLEWSARKKGASEANHRELERKSPHFKI
jgi:coenzyme F420 hydrogenase subunit beta